jgi:serine/threonine-protein kinase
MGFLDSLRVNQAIGTILEAPRGSAAAITAANQIRELGAGAVPRLVQGLTRDQNGSLPELLAAIVNNATLAIVVKDGLLSDDSQVTAGARRALAQAQQIDPNRLFELYLTHGGNAAEIADLLVSKKDGLTAKTMLRLLDLAKSDRDSGLFKLIDQLANEAMVPALVGFLKSAEWGGRVQIARTIQRFPSTSVRDALVQLLGDPHRLVREAALEGLAHLGLPVPPEPICGLLRDPDLMVQAKAIETAVTLNDPACIPNLLGILQDESEHSRRAAVEVLNAVGDANAIKDLVLALKDQDWWVRVRAADALGAIGGPKVIDAVLQLLGSADEFMRRIAMEILNTTKDERVFEYLVGALNDHDWWVRERAIDALANLGDKRAVPHLIALLAVDDEATTVVIRALAQLADPRAVNPIITKLDSREDRIQREAIGALGVLANAGQLETVLKALREFSPLSADIHEAAQAVVNELITRFKGSAESPSRASSAARPDLMQTIVASERLTRPAKPKFDQSLETTIPMVTGHAPDTSAHPHAPDRGTTTNPKVADESIDLNSVRPGSEFGGRYTVVSELGRGGFGTVLQVRDRMIGEDIALKLINPQLIQDEETITRFLHEVRYSRRITHENVIRVHDFLELGSMYAISMEYFASQPLSRRIRRGLHQRPAQGLRFVRDIARGMHVAHQANVMHRDLKPANILVNDADVLKIVDFGLAAACSHGNSRVTKTGTLIGTPSYMSPEQGRGLEIDYRTDIYSLGVIMYEVFTGTVPYAADNPLAVLYLHLQGRKDPPSARNPLISTALEAVILKAMALEAEERYQSANELLAALEPLEFAEAA